MAVLKDEQEEALAETPLVVTKLWNKKAHEREQGGSHEQPAEQ